MTKKSKIDHYTDKEALDFHIGNKSGKIEVNSSKPLISKRDLSLAYSPGVAAPVKEISKDASKAYDYTCLLYTSPSPRDRTRSRMPSSA